MKGSNSILEISPTFPFNEDLQLTVRVVFVGVDLSKEGHFRGLLDSWGAITQGRKSNSCLVEQMNAKLYKACTTYRVESSPALTARSTTVSLMRQSNGRRRSPLF